MLSRESRINWLLARYLKLVIRILYVQFDNEMCTNMYRKTLKHGMSFSSEISICCPLLFQFIVIMLLFHIGWLLCSLVLAVPVMLLTLLHILYKGHEVDCIDLKHYGEYILYPTH